jgi:hypothetical protein
MELQDFVCLQLCVWGVCVQAATSSPSPDAVPVEQAASKHVEQFSAPRFEAPAQVCYVWKIDEAMLL